MTRTVLLWCGLFGAMQSLPAFPPVREPSNALQPMTDQPAYDSWRGNQLDPVFNDTITRDAYGAGVHADENGEPTFDTELFNHKW
jgi:hypothetical protein